MPKIAIIGRRGGTGKTTAAHMLAAGISRLGAEATMVTTDHRPVRSSKGRPYEIVDGRTPTQLVKLLDSELSANQFLVVDSGPSRKGQFDAELARHVDTAIVPFCDDVESIETAIDYLERVPNALVMPMRWTTNRLAAKKVDGYLRYIEANFPGCLLPAVAEIHASIMLLDDEWSEKEFSASLKLASVQMAHEVILNNWIAGKIAA